MNVVLVRHGKEDNLNDDPDICNEVSGGWPLRAFLCKVYKAEKS